MTYYGQFSHNSVLKDAFIQHFVFLKLYSNDSVIIMKGLKVPTIYVHVRKPWNPHLTRLLLISIKE